jgi:hypothetical protein
MERKNGKLGEVIYRKDEVTVCLLVDKKTKAVAARGVSICALNDMKSNKDGRNRARGRAVQATVHKADASPIRDDRESNKVLKEEMPVLYAYKMGRILYDKRKGDVPCGNKAFYRPALTSFEKDLVAKVKFAKKAKVKATA